MLKHAGGDLPMEAARRAGSISPANREAAPNPVATTWNNPLALPNIQDKTGVILTWQPIRYKSKSICMHENYSKQENNRKQRQDEVAGR